MVRGGKLWSVAEEEQLCRSWLFITADPIEGTGQSNDHYWGRIQSHYAENWQGSEVVRSIQGFQGRWKKLNTMLLKWHSCLMQAASNRASGTNYMDELQLAQVFYSADMGSAFNKFHCWEIVKDFEKFKDPPTTPIAFSQPLPTQLSPIESTVDLGGDEEEAGGSDARRPGGRPMGRKAQKEARKKGQMQNVIDERKAKAWETLVIQNAAEAEAAKTRDEEFVKHMQWQQQLELRKEQLELRREAERKVEKEDEIMAKDTSIMSPNKRGYWQARQKSIIDSRSSNLGCGSMNESTQPNEYDPIHNQSQLFDYP